jgi:hypothetical protein
VWVVVDAEYIRLSGMLPKEGEVLFGESVVLEVAVEGVIPGSIPMTETSTSMLAASTSGVRRRESMRRFTGSSQTVCQIPVVLV